jgi:hypothetical protein
VPLATRPRPAEAGFAPASFFCRFRRVTSGAFGPEASVVAVAVCLGMTLVFAIAAVRARRWRALSFRLVLD